MIKYPTMVIRVSLISLLSLTAIMEISQAQIKRGFISRLGNDTLFVERYTRTPDQIEGDLASVNPRTAVTHYVATLGPKGTIVKFDVTTRLATAAPGASPQLERTSIITESMAISEIRRNGVLDTASSHPIKVKSNLVPYIGFSAALYEQMVMQARAMKQDSIPFGLLLSGGQQPFETYIVRKGNNLYRVGWFHDLSQDIQTDDSGSIVTMDNRGTTSKTITARVDDVDFEGMVKNFVAKETAGKPVGTLSPPDTARATIAGAQLEIRYSRPLKRGRTIFGNVVPWNQVWRTGANTATQFSTSKDIKIGTTVIPAGKYTLWTLPNPSITTLIFNKQTGQWGTDYDAKQDFVRLDMKTQPLPESIERFIISIVPQGDGGEIRFDWDTTRFSIPFSIQ